MQSAKLAAAPKLLVVGNLGQPFTAPAGVPTLMLGKPVADSWYRCGTLMQFSGDGKQLLAEWKVPYFGQTRLMDVKLDGGGAIYASGWSVSATSREPYWTPFLFKLDDAGREVWRAYAPDPMSGKDDRMGGLVVDSVIKSVGFADDGQLILAALSDGGNTVWTASPTDYTKPAQTRLKGSWTKVMGAERYKGATL